MFGRVGYFQCYELSVSFKLGQDNIIIFESMTYQCC
jgi:hypothetical protein